LKPQRPNQNTIIQQRPYDGHWEVLKLRYTEDLPTDLRLKYNGYPEYWQKRWIAVRVFKKQSDAIEFVGA